MKSEYALVRAVELGRADLVTQHSVESIVGPDEPHRMGAIHLAARRGRGDFVRLMLDAGADVNRRTEVNSTPLHFAVVGGSVDVIHLS